MKRNNFSFTDEKRIKYDINDEIEEDDFVQSINPFKNEWKTQMQQDYEKKFQGLIFQETKTEYILTNSRTFGFDYPGPKNTKIPVIRMFGITESRKSVMCNIWGFRPYLYIEVPNNITPEMIDELRRKIESENKCIRLIEMEDKYDKEIDECCDIEEEERLEESKEYKLNFFKKVVRCIDEIEVVERYTIWKVNFGHKKKLLKVYTFIPSNVSAIRKIVEQGINFDGNIIKYQTYESNVLFVLRCLYDKNIYPTSWIELRNYEYSTVRESLCDIEVNVSVDNIRSHKSEGIYDKIAPLCILSFDIECYGNVERGKSKTIVRFPKANIPQCRVIQIANTVTINQKILIKNCFCLGTCAEVDDQVLCFDDENTLLSCWRDFVNFIDPDILTGYNIINFDIPYLLDRAKFLCVSDFAKFGRVINSNCYYREQQMGSKQTGKRISKNITMYGRIILDMMNYTKINAYPKLSSYSLNYVSNIYLGRQKLDVSHIMIPTLQDTSNLTRKKLVQYCIVDAELPQKLMDKMTAIQIITEKSRVKGIPFEWITERGQQIGVYSQLIRYASPKGFVIPALNIVMSESFTGAIVKEPKIGYHRNPISILDFASLYPSIMIEHNLCYTTLIPPSQVRLFTPDQYTKTPCGHHFVKPHVFQGFLPEILKNLLSARGAVKKIMWGEKDPIRKAVLNGRQLALKVSANSIYGFTGVKFGMLPFHEISSSVTAFGRKMIEDTTDWVEKRFRKGIIIKWPEKLKFRDGSHEEAKSEYILEHDAKVIYGDTFVTLFFFP